MISKHILAKACLGSSLVTALAVMGTAESAQAATWTLNNAFVDGTTPIIGSFTIDNESGNPPTLTSSNITVGNITFTETDLDPLFLPLSNPLDSIFWTRNSDTLSFSFENPLTPLGGTVNLDALSDFNVGLITGQVTAPTEVPEPLTLLGAGTAIAIGSGFKRKRQS